MSNLRVYQSTADGVSRQFATKGGAADRRFARSKRWSLIGVSADGVHVQAIENGAAVEAAILSTAPPPGEHGTFDEVRGTFEGEATGEPREGIEVALGEAGSLSTEPED